MTPNLVGPLTALLALMLSLAALMIPAPSTAQGRTVTLQWLGWSHYRFTSPEGRVLLTNPFVNNPDSPVRLVDITVVPPRGS